MFFEGPEKKLELAVAPGGPSLRSLGRPYWESVVRAARAKILSSIEGEAIDAYLLSESSLFVADRWLTMITCGRTDLVSAVLKLIKDLGRKRLRYLIYERKNAHFQEYQPANFFDDLKRLRRAAPGKGYRFGDGDDHHLFMYHLDRAHVPDAGDRTLEILMHGIDPAAARIFIQGPGHTRDYIRERSGIWDLRPGFAVDDHLFEPMGYSLNAIKGPHYYTVHVTPQAIGSYVSFETNCLEPGPSRLIERVLSIFRPRSCDVVLFKPSGDGLRARCALPLKSATRQVLDCGYEVSFGHHFAPRVGPAPALELSA